MASGAVLMLARHREGATTPPPPPPVSGEVFAAADWDEAFTSPSQAGWGCWASGAVSGFNHRGEGGQFRNYGTGDWVSGSTPYTYGDLFSDAAVVLDGTRSARIDHRAFQGNQGGEFLMRRGVRLGVREWFSGKIRFSSSFANADSTGHFGALIAQLNYVGIFNSPFAMALTPNAHRSANGLGLDLILLTGKIQTNAAGAFTGFEYERSWNKLAPPLRLIPPARLGLAEEHDYILGVTWSTTNTGSVEFWHRRPATETDFVQTIAPTGGFPTVQWLDPYMSVTGQKPDGSEARGVDKIGLYRGPSNTAVQVWHDRWGKATTFEAAEARLG
jgi:hypothetical protein